MFWFLGRNQTSSFLCFFSYTVGLITEKVQLDKQAPPEDAGIPFLTHLGTFSQRKIIQPPFLKIIAKLVKRQAGIRGYLWTLVCALVLVGMLCVYILKNRVCMLCSIVSLQRRLTVFVTHTRFRGLHPLQCPLLISTYSLHYFVISSAEWTCI